MKTKSVLEFIQWVNDRPPNTIFRGQANALWQLLPSIDRYAKAIKDDFTSIFEVEENLIIQFEKFSTPYKDYREVSLLEKLIDAQHYGLPTRLLDWTTNPLKALYFAVENSELDSSDGMVFSFAPQTWYEGTKYLKEQGLDSNLFAFYPEMLNERLGAQEGCFVSFTLPIAPKSSVLALTNSNYPKEVFHLDNIIIQAESKQQIRFELNKFGINQKSIYPGLEGVAKWVRSSLSNFRL